MKHLRLFISKLLLVICCLLPVVSFADIKEDYEESQTLLLAARACLAIYSDRTGRLSYEYLTQEGWEIQPFVADGDIDDARFLIAKKEPADGGQPVYILAIAGTETIKNMKTNLTLGQVYFAGRTPEEFAANAALRHMPDSVPKVHHGFYKYVEAAFQAKVATKNNGTPRLLTDLLLENRDRKVYLTGHSLGGAAATIAGARLLSLGVNPDQIEVITFGAPAVGNKAFVDQFAPVLPLTRVVIDGDPITGILQGLSGYEQFGREILWKTRDVTHKGQHAMVGYLDVAVKNYYDERHQAEQAGLVELSVNQTTTGGPLVYVTPAENYLPEELQPEFWYMQQALWDEYRRVLPDYVLANAEAMAHEQAAARGCRLMLVPEISAYKLKTKRHSYYVTLDQTVYDTATGRIVAMTSFSTNTSNLTPLGALIHNSRGISAANDKWLNAMTEDGELAGASLLLSVSREENDANTDS